MSVNNGTTWTPITGQTFQTYAPPALMQTTWYRRLTRGVKNGAGGFDCTAASNVIMIAVNSPGAIVADPVTDVVVCMGDPTSLTGSGSGTLATYQWEMSTNGGTTWTIVPLGAPSPYSVNPSTPGKLEISSVTIAMSTSLYRLAMVTPAPCSITARSQVIRIKIRNVWLGLFNTNWNNASNWSDGNVATIICDDVHIPDVTTDPTLNTVGAPQITNLKIYPGGNLTLSGSAAGAKLMVRGHITKDPLGFFNAIAGTLEMNGGTAGNCSCSCVCSPGNQTIDASTFTNNALGNLIVNNNPPALTLLGDVDIYESVEFGANGNILNTGNFLTLKSLPGLTARMGELTGKTINGETTVERYLHSRIAWRFLSVPTWGSGQTIHQAWQENKAPTVGSTPAGYGTNITGPTFPSDGFDEYSQRHSMKYFHKDAFDGYNVITNTAGVISQDPPIGYMVFVRGNRTMLNGPGPTTLRTKGKLFQGDKSFIVEGAVGWNSVGNPYASRINVRTLVKNNVVDAFVVWNPDLGGLYGVGGFATLTFNGSNYVATPGGGIRNYIESGEAFYIQTNNLSDGSISISESDKRQGSSDVSFAPGRDINLRVDIVSSQGTEPEYLADGILLNFNNRYSKDFDNDDVKKLSNAANNLAVSLGDNYLVAERTAIPEAGDSIHLALYSTRVQNYRFDFQPENLDRMQNLQPFLYDKYLDSYFPIAVTGNSSMDFSITAQPGSKAMDRFTIVFRKLRGKSMHITLAANRQADSTIAVTWKVDDEQDVLKYEIERSTDGRLFLGIITVDATGNNHQTVTYRQTDIGSFTTDNHYRIKITENEGFIRYSKVVKVGAEPIAVPGAEIIIYPNPVTGKTVQLRFNNEPAGKYNVQLLNSLGQVLQTNSVVLDGNGKTVSISLGASVNPGQYQIKFVGPGGKTTQQALLVE
jgi:hypothetical protein